MRDLSAAHLGATHCAAFSAEAQFGVRIGSLKALRHRSSKARRSKHRGSQRSHPPSEAAMGDGQQRKGVNGEFAFQACAK